MSRRRFRVPGSKEMILNKCPICGEELEYVELFQYSNVYRILKNGKCSKVRKFRRDEGSMECGFITCTNCDFHTDCDYDTDNTGKYKHIYIHESDIPLEQCEKPLTQKGFIESLGKLKMARGK